MRASLLFALLMLATVAAADSPETVTHTREEIDAFELRLEQMLQEREAAAYRAGQADQKQRCASLI
jgi:hypothetical protein